jgi:uncharacterized cupin superfamily protein
MDGRGADEGGDMTEARLEQTEAGTTAATDGWFTVNLRDAAWERSETFGAAGVVESAGAVFAQIGYTLCLVQPGQPSALYHRETEQEDFLVLAGECLLLVEEQERRLKAWDFVHCPAGTAHIFVGAGDGPCVIFMAGARREGSAVVYPRSELALAYGAGVERQTDEPAEAYAPFAPWRPWPRAERAGTAADPLRLFAK